MKALRRQIIKRLHLEPTIYGDQMILTTDRRSVVITETETGYLLQMDTAMLDFEAPADSIDSAILTLQRLIQIGKKK
mgnify:CR=1 FL=1